MSDAPVLIRSLHRAAFRSGEWARIVGVIRAPEAPCYRVEFIDGATDNWLMGDAAAEYEFR